MEAQFAFWRSGRRDGGPLDVMGEIGRRLAPDDVRAVSLYYAAQARAPIEP